MEPVDERLTYEERIAALSFGDAAHYLTAPRLLKLTVDDLVVLDRHWHDDDHKSTELIDGRVYFTPARYMPRVRVAQDIWLQLRDAARVVAPHLFVGMRGSIEVSPYDLPLPDIVLTSEANGQDFIPAASVPLVVEVADAAIDFYMVEKMELYAFGGIPEYWMVDLLAQCIHRWSEPAARGYASHDKIQFGEPIASVTMGAIEVNTMDLA